MSVGRLGIAGVGLIGGSIALRARAAWPHIPIVGYDSDPAATACALDRGIIDASADSLTALNDAVQTLVIALPVDAAIQALTALAGRSGPTLVIDVASVKEPLIAAGANVANFVGTHPMAGREQSGLDWAQAELFAGATWAYVPHPGRELVARARAFISAMGADPLEIGAARHDEIVALTSHLPQALSVLLGSALAVAADSDGAVMDLCGPGMMSMLRLARSPQAIWAPIVAANAAPLSRQLRSLAEALQGVAAALESGESESLMSYFNAAHDASTALEQRFPPPPRSSAYRFPPRLSNPTPPPAR